MEKQAREARAANRGTAAAPPSSTSARPGSANENSNEEFHTQDNEDEDDEDDDMDAPSSESRILLRGGQVLGRGNPPPYSNVQTDQTDTNGDETPNSN